MTGQIANFLLVIFLFLSSAEAKLFTSKFVQFELPPGWECALEGSEWVCQSTNKERHREAIIILAAKVRGKQDSLNDYEAHLKKAKPFTLPGGRKQVSEPKYAKIREIGGHSWVDALHLASEVPGFYTQYLATVKGDLGLAVTFSVAKDMYDAYRPVFDKVIGTLKVFANAQKVTEFKRPSGDNGPVVGNIQDDSLDIDPTLAGQQKSAQTKESSDDMTLYLLLLLAVAGFIGFKKFKAKKSKSSKKK